MVKEGEKLVTNAIYDHFLEQDKHSSRGVTKDSM
jgi:hypothetical protein